MQIYTLNIRSRRIAVEGDDTLVRTSRGVDRLLLRFDDDEWMDVSTSVALSIGGELVELPLSLSVSSDWACQGTVDVPDSMLLAEGRLAVTVHGVKQDGTHVITEFAEPLRVVLEGYDGTGGHGAEVVDGMLVLDASVDGGMLVVPDAFVADGFLKLE